MAPDLWSQRTSRGQSSCTLAGLSVSSQRVGPAGEGQGTEDIDMTLAVVHVALSFCSSIDGNWIGINERLSRGVEKSRRTRFWNSPRTSHVHQALKGYPNSSSLLVRLRLPLDVDFMWHLSNPPDSTRYENLSWFLWLIFIKISEYKRYTIEEFHHWSVNQAKRIGSHSSSKSVASVGTMSNLKTGLANLMRLGFSTHSILF